MVTQIQLGNLFSANGRNVLSGSASGIDTQALVTSLVEAKLKPATDLQDKIDTNTKQIAAYGEMRSKLAALQTDADFLRNPPGVNNATNNAFAYRTANVSASGSVAASNYLSVTVQPGATIQNYVIDNITQVAQAKEQTTGTFDIEAVTDSVVATVPVGTQFGVGTITVNGTDIAFANGDSLQAVANKFNLVKGSTGIAAQIIKTADHSFQLLFIATATGEEADFDMTDIDTVEADPSGVLANITPDIDLVQDAKNASFDINGVTIERQSNSITDLVDGVTFNILHDTVSVPTTKIDVQIAPDTVSVANAIVNFANDYNDFKFFYAKQTERNADGTPTETAILAQSSTLNSVLNSVLTQLTSIVTGITGGNPSQLADLGITLSDFAGDATNPAAGNIMNVDTSKLQSALQSNFDGAKNVFGFNFVSDSNALQVFRHTKTIGVNSLTIDINTTTHVYQASYIDGEGVPRTEALTGTVGATSILLSGASTGPLAGLQLIYTSDASATIHVTASQGVADMLYNTLTDTLNQQNGTVQSEVSALTSTNTRYSSSIDDINNQVALYKDQLLNKFAQLEASITKVNNILAGLNAQQLANSSNG